MLTSYGTIAKANEYFSQRLHTQDWDDCLESDRQKALFMATRAIDRLNFEGEKHDDAQEHQFPRGDDEEVPVEIEYATYECALAYLGGVNIDNEIRNIGLSSVSISGVRDEFRDGYVPEHLRAGIPSVEAWIYLRPFLRDPKHFVFSRVS
jgi:hypothetical protein